MSEAEKITLARKAIFHVLNTISYDPRKFWLMGNGTESFHKLTEAYAELTGEDQEAVIADCQPPSKEWEEYCEERKYEKFAVTYCRDRGIKKEAA